jgi:membrane-associated phospholipid phosphatase
LRASPRAEPAAAPPVGADAESDAAAGLGILAAGAAITALVADRRTRASLQCIDDRWYELIQRSRTAPRMAASRVLDIGFGTTLDWSARVAVTVLLARQRRWRTLAGWAATIALSEVCIGPIKSAIGRPRPGYPLTKTSESSYPSGHAIAAASTAPGIVLALLPPGPGRQRVLGSAVALAAATAISRTDLNAHWLSDCVGGFCLGTGFALAVPTAVNALADARAGK